MKYPVLILLALLFMASCTTIEIAEKDAFDVKRTIYPADLQEGPYQLERKHIATDSLMLNAWWITRPNARGTVLYFGGNGFVKENGYHIIHSILAQQMNLLVFNYRGYGRNPGTPSIAGLKADGMAAYHYLRDSLQAPGHKIIIHGHSLGTFVASYVAARKQAAGLVLQSPLTNARDMTNALVPWFLRPLINFEIDQALRNEDNLREIKNVQEPLLVISGGQDKITPQQMAHDLHDAAVSNYNELKIIEGGPHNGMETMKAYRQKIRMFYHRFMPAVSQETSPGNQADDQEGQ